MLLKIEHMCEYVYSAPVTLDPHILRLTPRFASNQRVMEEGVTITPQPAGQSRCISPEGCIHDIVWFTGRTEKLTVMSSLVVSLKENNPYDFLIYPNEGQILPLKYSAQLTDIVAPMLAPLSDSPIIKEAARELAEYSNNQTIPFITNLMQKISQEFEYVIRAEGSPQTPQHTWDIKKGSCRDLVVLSMAILRQTGIAARFVSGYFIESFDSEPELHAWVEVYLPGGGWRGFDPTCGIACYGHHVALSASVNPKETMPVEGAYRGNAESFLQTTLKAELIKKDSNWFITA